jgi:hypothetical protein
MKRRNVQESRKDLTEKARREPAVPAVYVRRKGFACTNHILYCPDLSKADRSKAFYLSCSKHHLMFKINLAKQSREFIADFPKGCKGT